MKEIEIGKTNWQAIVMTWEDNNKDCKFPKSDKDTTILYFNGKF